MKRLTLIRHAKSSWADPGMADFDRPLNERGQRDAPMMGQRLAQRQMQPDLLLSSPANRALTTARTIAAEIGYPVEHIATEPRIYEAEVSHLVDVVQQLDDRYRHVFLFGHNPGFTELSYYLSNHRVDNIPTCGVFCIDFDFDAWAEVAPGSGGLVFFDYPKKQAD